MSETILEAYCVELDSIVDIEEARVAFFAQTEPRDRFNFQCSDIQCRNLSTPPEITGVNYAVEDYKRTPHFRRHKDHVHVESCYWGQYTSILNGILQNKKQRQECIEKGDKNLFRDFKDFDVTKVYDEFHLVPKQQNQAPREPALNTEQENTPESIRHRIIYEHKKTRSLSNLVDMFRALDDKQKDTAMLTLPNLPCTIENDPYQPYPNTPRHNYQKAFKPVSYIKDYFRWTHIYYGKAKIYKYSKKLQGYRIFFQNTPYDYCKTDIKYGVSAFIPLSDFDNNRYSKKLQKDLDTYAANNQECCCYILANVTHLQKSASFGAKNIDPGVNILVFDMVLRETTPNCR